MWILELAGMLTFLPFSSAWTVAVCHVASLLSCFFFFFFFFFDYDETCSFRRAGA
jgi:hypothetical protein